ncbi:MAG: LEA type 2 family protein [Spirochaetaceae bacterium]|nr:LEA type 2 family protein [Spirochaetaceae bacterium]
MKATSFRRLAFRFTALFFAGLTVSSCALKEALMPVQPTPEASLKYESMEARDPNHLLFLFTLETGNPREDAAKIRAGSWTLMLDGQDLTASAQLVIDELLPPGGSPQERILANNEARQFPARLTVNMEQFLRNSPPEAGRESEVSLRLEMTYEYPFSSKILIHTRSSVTIPQVRSPQFSIRSIGVKKAELINTRFLVRISVDNPNVFPVDLSSFNYALYNKGRYWAGGSKNDILRVPAGSSAETDLSLVMNFINMGRGLLDEVIDMRQVDYRFAGTAVVDTGLAYLPRFQWAYDQSGRSPVTE